MREISMKAKMQVITLFFTGLSYDQISQNTGVSKGAVVNIIDDYREGRLILTGNITECVDELRRVAVDLKKNHTTVSQVMSHVKIYTRLREMGVDAENLEQWLDICRDIASPTSSDGQFVTAALELAGIESQTGLTYQEIVNQYKKKLDLSIELDEEIEAKEERLDEARLRYEREEKQAQNQLASITAAIATAQETFRKQKDELKSQLEEYRAQNKLSWKKVNTSVSLLNSELSKADLTQKDVDSLAEQIRSTGSLTIYVRQLERKQKELYQVIEQLKKTTSYHTAMVKSLERSRDELQQIIRKTDKSKCELEERMRVLEAQRELKRDEFTELMLILDNCRHNLYITEIIIELLSNPGYFNDVQLDRLVGLMVAIRQKRKGINPVWRIEDRGNPVCECVVPEIYRSMVHLPEVDIDGIREQLASYLFPIVKDKFITKYAHELAMQKAKKEYEQAIKQSEQEHELAIRQIKQEHELAMKQRKQAYEKAAGQAMIEVIQLLGSKK